MILNLNLPLRHATTVAPSNAVVVMPVQDVRATIGDVHSAAMADQATAHDAATLAWERQLAVMQCAPIDCAATEVARR